LATLIDSLDARTSATNAEHRCLRIDESATAREDGMIKTPNSIAPKIVQSANSSVPWLETQAEISGCRYEFARMNTLSLGIATDSNHFLISFTYYAHATTFSGEFTSPVAMEKGKTFPIFYNPLNPQQNRQSEQVPTSGTPLFAVGIAGSIVLSLVYLSLMHGCN
jgi:hypothetical protein